MTDQISHDSQYITGSGASGAGDGDEGWQQQRQPRQRKGGSPSASGGSRATKSTVPSLVLVVPSGQAQGAVSWVRKHWKGAPMQAHLKGWTDSRKTLSKILLEGAEAEKCAKLLVAKVKNWSEQKQGRKGTKGSYVAPGARTVHTLSVFPLVGKSALFKAKDGSAVHFTPAKEQDSSGKTFKFSLSGGSKEQQEAVLATATELAHQMACVVRLPASVAGFAVKRAQKDYEENTGSTIDIERHRYQKEDEFHYAYVLSSDEVLVESLHGALVHFAEEISAKNAEFLRMYLSGKFALVLEKEVLKDHKQRWSERYTITKPRFLPKEVAEKHHPKEGFVFVMFPDTEKGSKCLKKARDLTKRHLDKKKEAKSGGAAAKKTSSPPKAPVSAADYYVARDAAKAKGKTVATQKGGGAKAPAPKVVFRTGGGFDALADEAEVDPTRTEATVVPTEKKSPKTSKKVIAVEYSVGPTLDETVRDRTLKKREDTEKFLLAETAREECSAQFAEAAVTAAPMGSVWSAMAKKEPEVKKVEQDELPTPATVVCKQTKTVKSTEEEKWQVKEDYDHWTPPSTPVGFDEETGGWNM